MTCKGKKDVHYAENRGDRLHVIFDNHNNPIYSCRKDEVKELFTNEFRRYFDIWQYYHNGFGLPYGGAWGDYDPIFINTILQMEIHYKNNFSIDSVKLKYLEAIIKRMDHYASVFGKRR